MKIVLVKVVPSGGQSKTMWSYHCPLVFSTKQTANVSFLSCEFHRSLKPRNDHRATKQSVSGPSINQRQHRQKRRRKQTHPWALFSSVYPTASVCKQILMFWSWRHHVPSKHEEPLTQWHNFISRHNRILSYTAVKTSITATSTLYRTWWACMSSFIRSSQALIFSWDCCTLPPSSSLMACRSTIDCLQDSSCCFCSVKKQSMQTF